MSTTTNTTTRPTEARETGSLIGSDKVEGTNLYRSNGEKVGSIERVMIDKRSGKGAYAVLSFGYTPSGKLGRKSRIVSRQL